MARCRDCKLYDLEAVKSKSGAVLSSRVAKCLWVSKEVWPVSVLGDGWRNRRPIATRMSPNDGERCPTFIERLEP